MSKQQKKKVDFECCVFKAQWKVDYLSVIKLDVKALCLLCSNTIAMLKNKIQYTSTLSDWAFDTIFTCHRNVTEKLEKV